jgi:hypothetical protein
MAIDTRRVNLQEIGTYGVPRYGNQIDDEELNDLRGYRRIKTIRQMLHNDATIGAVMFAIKMMIRQVKWRVDAASSNSQDQEAAEFVWGNFNDMSVSMGNMLSDIVSFVPWGYSWHEVVYKLRGGLETDDPMRRSKFTDGKIGWRKIPIRRQETNVGWVFDDNGGVQGFIQQAAPDYAERVIPIDRSLLFQTENAGGNPEGYSALRNTYRAWRLKTRIENLEAIGAERDLAGYPMLELPSAYMDPAAAPEHQAVYEDMKKVATNIRNDEQGGGVIPSDRDEDGNRLFDVRLISSAGSKQFNTGAIVDRLDHRILMSMMADFLMLGGKEVGSFALSSDKTDLWGMALGTWAGSVADVFNQHGTPRLLRVNGFKVDEPPMLRHEDIETPNLGELGDYIDKLMRAGALTPDPGLETYVRQAASLPELPEDLREGQDQ